MASGLAIPAVDNFNERPSAYHRWTSFRQRSAVRRNVRLPSEVGIRSMGTLYYLLQVLHERGLGRLHLRRFGAPVFLSKVVNATASI
jgi:hypothetical protein